MSNTRHTLILSAAAGALCGTRSMALAATLARSINRKHPGGFFSSGLASRFTSAGLAMLAVGEAVADKTPLVPSRIEILPLLGRIGAAKLCAVVIAEQRRESIFAPAAVAAVGAVAGAYASFHIRQLLTKSVGIPDPIVAIAEDALVVSSATALTRAAIPS